MEKESLAWASLIYITSRAMQVREIILWTRGGHREDLDHGVDHSVDQEWSDHYKGRRQNIGCENPLMVHEWSGKTFPWRMRSEEKS